jgi:hypothetical protein
VTTQTQPQRPKNKGDPYNSASSQDKLTSLDKQLRRRLVQLKAEQSRIQTALEELSMRSPRNVPRPPSSTGTSLSLSSRSTNSSRSR